MDHRYQFTVEKMCIVFGVSRSGYYKWCNRKRYVKQKKADLADKIRCIYHQSRRNYGSPRIATVLNKTKHLCSKATVARYMKQLRIAAIRKKKFRSTTNANHNYKVADNLLNRQFEVQQPGKVWVSDITYIRVGNSWLYLTVIIDLADRMVLSWTLSNNLSAANTIIKAFKKAVLFRRPCKGLLFHSDRGVQYACYDFTKLLSHYNAQQSMSRKANCWDNAVAESFFKTLKVECVYRHNFNNKQQAKFIIFDYIDGWYNTVRIHSALAGISPLQAYVKKKQYLETA